MRMRARAAPDGERRPCSHSWRVRLEMFKTPANCACERPVLWRACTTSFASTLVTRAACPAFISRTDCKSFKPRASPEETRFLVGGWLAIFDFLSNCLEYM